MKQSQWMNGLLYAENKSKILEVSGMDNKYILSTLRNIVRQEMREYLYCKEWIDGVSSYIKHYDRTLRSVTYGQ